MTEKISAIKIGKRFRKDLGDIDALAQNIETVGLLHPVVIDERKNLIAGLRRIEACKKLGWKEIPVTVVNLKDLVAGEYSENERRKDFTPSEAVAIAEALEKREKEKAKLRQKQAGKKFGKGKIASGNFPEAIIEKGQTRDKIARPTGYSSKTLEKARELINAAREDPKYQPFVDEMDKTGKVDGIYKKYKVEKLEKEKKELYKNIAKVQGKIIHGDCTELLNQLPDRYFECLITDPPYSNEIRDFKTFLTSWVERAARKIKLSGRIYIFSGPYIEEIRDYIDVLSKIQDFQLANLIIWHYKNALGPRTKLRYKYSWNGIFYLYGKEAKDLNCPLTKDLFDHFEYSLPDARHEKKYHPHQKSSKLIQDLIVASTKEGDYILDLFAGSGEIGINASLLGRHSLSIEINAKNVAICQERGLILCEKW